MIFIFTSSHTSFYLTGFDLCSLVRSLPANGEKAPAAESHGIYLPEHTYLQQRWIHNWWFVYCFSLLHFNNEIPTQTAGVCQNGSLTNHDLYEMCLVFIIFNPANVPWAIFHLNADGSTAALLSNTDAVLLPGKYIILTSGE